MNPLSLPAERFLIAENADGSMMGFGQLQEQPNSQNIEFLELRTLIVDDSARYYICKAASNACLRVCRLLCASVVFQAHEACLCPAHCVHVLLSPKNQQLSVSVMLVPKHA